MHDNVTKWGPQCKPSLLQSNWGQVVNMIAETHLAGAAATVVHNRLLHENWDAQLAEATPTGHSDTGLSGGTMIMVKHRYCFEGVPSTVLQQAMADDYGNDDGQRWCAGVLRLRGCSLLLVEAYFVTRLPLTHPRNQAIMRQISCLVGLLCLPVVLAADWQNTPQQVEDSGWLQTLRMEMVVPIGEGTCTQAGRMIDFFAVSSSIRSLVVASWIEQRVPWRPHFAAMLEMVAKPLSVQGWTPMLPRSLAIDTFLVNHGKQTFQGDVWTRCLSQAGQAASAMYEEDSIEHSFATTGAAIENYVFAVAGLPAQKGCLGGGTAMRYSWRPVVRWAPSVSRHACVHCEFWSLCATHLQVLRRCALQPVLKRRAATELQLMATKVPLHWADKASKHDFAGLLPQLVRDLGAAALLVPKVLDECWATALVMMRFWTQVRAARLRRQFKEWLVQQMICKPGRVHAHTKLTKQVDLLTHSGASNPAQVVDEKAKAWAGVWADECAAQSFARARAQLAQLQASMSLAPCSDSEKLAYEDFAMAVRRYPGGKAVGCDGWRSEELKALPTELLQRIHLDLQKVEASM